MRYIQNTCLQGFYIPFNTPSGLYEVYLKPKSTIAVPSNFSSNILDNLLKRRLVKVTVAS